jgi:uroporphyrinogen-III decarboxylase
MADETGRQSFAGVSRIAEKYSFLDFVRTPELCAEVTLQPLQRFNFDVAIISSVIFCNPEALGQGYASVPKGDSNGFCG